MNEIQIEIDGNNRSGIPKLLVDGHEVVVRGLTLRTDAGHIPRLELELAVWDITSLNAANVEVLVDPATSGYLERAGWTPPPGVASVLDRDAGGCPCEWKDTGWPETPERILGRKVPTCPVHGVKGTET